MLDLLLAESGSWDLLKRHPSPKAASPVNRTSISDTCCEYDFVRVRFTTQQDSSSSRTVPAFRLAK